MIFKQLQIFQSSKPIPYDADYFADKMSALRFTPCLPSLPMAFGWVAPIGDEEDAPLVFANDGYLLLCMQVEEKILPATVIRQTLAEKIKALQEKEDRKISRREKLNLKDEVTHTLLPQAFSRYSRIYYLLDSKRQWVMLNNTTPSKSEWARDLFKKSFPGLNLQTIQIKKLPPIMTRWLRYEDCPSNITIGKNALLRDPNNEQSTVRAQQQDLFSEALQALLNDNFQVHQLALDWQQRLTFTLNDDFTIKNIKYGEQLLQAAADIYSESIEQQFAADFYIMGQSLAELMQILLAELQEHAHSESQEDEPAEV